MRPRSLRDPLPIVVAVLGFVALLAVLYPVFAPAGPRSHRRSGLASIRRGVVALLIYAADHDDALPVGPTPAGPSALGWADRIARILKSKDALRDPDDPGATMSYAMNANAAELPRLSAATHPDRSVLLFEIGGFPPHPSAPPIAPVGDGAIGGLVDSLDPTADPVVRYATGVLANSNLSSEGSWPRHAGKADFAFLDGHAGRAEPGAIVAGANARHPGDARSENGCRRPDLPHRDRPCAEATDRTAPRGRSYGTFSLR